MSPDAKPIRVLLVDDHQLLTGSLSQILDREPDIEVAGVAATVEEAKDLSRERMDVVLMDYRLPELGGVEATSAITSRFDTAVVVLTATAEEGELEALMAAGAVACLTKDSELEEIVRAIRDASLRGASLV